VFFTLLQRGWAILAGGLTLILIPSCFTAVEQGYYYTFASLIGLQVFFDLGFNSVIVQLVSHEYAHIKVGADGRLQGTPQHIGRLHSLSRLLQRWYRIASVLFFVGICPIGFAFFQSKGGLGPSEWLGPWCLQIFFTAINLYFSPMLAISEGQGEVGQVARLRLLQSIAGYILLWCLIVAGAKLWVTPIPSACSALGTAWWLRRRGRRQPEVPSTDAEWAISWRNDIFPFQWRIALSWVSGYFIFSLFTPMLFANQGATEAGKVGMALTIFSSLVTLGMSWVSAKVPNFSAHVALGERTELNRLFKSVLTKSFLFTLLSCLSVVGVLTLLRSLSFPPMQRIAGLPVLLCLTAVTMANVVIFSAAAYMRAHKEEPMLMNSVGTGILVLGGVYYFSQVSAFATICSYMTIVVFVSLPWTLMLFRPYYARTA
jgi:O-antigen/teichoic acid export membrane protein